MVLGDILNDFLPYLLVLTLSEQHVVHRVEHARIVKLVSHLLKSLFERRVELRIAQITNTIGVHEMSQVSIRDLVHILHDDPLTSYKCPVLTAHFVPLSTTQGSQDICHIVGIKLTFMS